MYNQNAQMPLNFKGAVMEALVKYHMSSPTIKSYRVGGTDHQPEWKCLLTHPTLKNPISSIRNSKANAENAAYSEFWFSLKHYVKNRPKAISYEENDKKMFETNDRRKLFEEPEKRKDESNSNGDIQKFINYIKVVIPNSNPTSSEIDLTSYPTYNRHDMKFDPSHIFVKETSLRGRTSVIIYKLLYPRFLKVSALDAFISQDIIEIQAPLLFGQLFPDQSANDDCIAHFKQIMTFYNYTFNRNASGSFYKTVKPHPTVPIYSEDFGLMDLRIYDDDTSQFDVKVEHEETYSQSSCSSLFKSEKYDEIIKLSEDYKFNWLPLIKQYLDSKSSCSEIQSWFTLISDETAIHLLNTDTLVAYIIGKEFIGSVNTGKGYEIISIINIDSIKTVQANVKDNTVTIMYNNNMITIYLNNKVMTCFVSHFINESLANQLA